MFKINGITSNHLELMGLQVIVLMIHNSVVHYL